MKKVVLLRVIDNLGVLNFVDIQKHGCPGGLHDRSGNTSVIVKKAVI